MERDEESLALDSLVIADTTDAEEYLEGICKRKPIITQADVIDLCRKIEDFCPKFGCHIALTGGYLYKDGPRKDIDLLFYRIRQIQINREGLIQMLENLFGMVRGKKFGWIQKMTWKGKGIDIFFPEHIDSEIDESSEY